MGFFDRFKRKEQLSEPLKSQTEKVEIGDVGGIIIDIEILKNAWQGKDGFSIRFTGDKTDAQYLVGRLEERFDAHGGIALGASWVGNEWRFFPDRKGTLSAQDVINACQDLQTSLPDKAALEESKDAKKRQHEVAVETEQRHEKIAARWNDEPISSQYADAAINYLEGKDITLSEDQKSGLREALNNVQQKVR